ncbi:Fanconi anemia group D2 [Zea mays]|uniref:Fanconi anemia group D2 n=2 Tax=Zea mays TaxID=4577 RepID=A0A317Y8F4_MAIZE|nr:Fanconi anemia group D2 [Zea mays]
MAAAGLLEGLLNAFLKDYPLSLPELRYLGDCSGLASTSKFNIPKNMGEESINGASSKRQKGCKGKVSEKVNPDDKLKQPTILDAFKRAGVTVSHAANKASSQPSSSEMMSKDIEQDATDPGELGLIDLMAAPVKLDIQRYKFRTICATCLSLLNYSELLGIPDLLNQPNMSILKQLLQTLQPTENFDDVLSEFQPSLAPCNVDYLYCGACKILEDIMDLVSSFSYLLSSDVLITIQSIVNSVVVLLDKSGEPNGKNIHMGCSKAIIPFLRKRLGYSAHKLLSADFPSEDAGKGWQSKGDLIQKILQIYLRNSDSTSDLLAEIGRELPKEPLLKTKDNQDVSYGFPTLCSSTITSWYRVLHEENTGSLNKTIKQALKARGSVDTILQEIQKSVDAFVSLIGMCKSHEKVSMHAMAVKHGGKFIDTFLKAFNFLERHFKQHNDTIVKMVRVSHVPFGITVELQWLVSVADEIMLIQLKQLQKGTRIIQSICSDAKGNKRTMITSKVPPRRDPWSDSCFRSRRCYTAAPPRRNSRWAYGNVDEEDEEQTEIDSDLPADEHDNGNAMEEDVVEGTSLVIWSWR